MEVVGFSTELIKEMKSIKDDLECIKLRMVDTEMILTIEDEGILEEGLREFEEGKTISLSDLKRDRGEICDRIEQSAVWISEKYK